MADLVQARRLVSQEDAHMIPGADVPRSRFVGSWSWKGTFDAGYLVPFLVDEVLPGDHLKYEVGAYVRMATPIFPMMDSQRIDTFFFFVPWRLVWANTNKFFGEQDSPGDSINYTIPYIDSPVGGFGTIPFTNPVRGLYDSLALPMTLTAGQTIRINVLPLRAYALIYHEWFRDQAVIASWRPPTHDGGVGEVYSNYYLRRRAKSADYFTTALPWPQRFTAPTVSLGTEAPVYGVAFNSGGAVTAGSPGGTVEVGGAAPAGWAGYFNATVGTFFRSATAVGLMPRVYADLSQATGIAISTFREAFLVQQLLERDARGGTRYTEIVKSHFRVSPPDFRLQRPEFMGGGSARLNLTPIAQTDDAGLGTLGAAGTSLGEHRASIAATEHGYVIGLINVRSELSYQQGLERKWTRRTRYDVPWPSLAGMGEQAVLAQEIRCTGVDAEDSVVFGYQERYQEWRTNVSRVTGYFRSEVAGTLDAWHLSQSFATTPTLSQAFIEDTPPMERVLKAAELAEGQQYLADILVRRDAVRPLPMFGTPVTLGRF